MSAEILRAAANAARDEWEGETAGIFKNAAQIHVAAADLLDATAADLDKNSILDYAADDQRCHCERWTRALTLARAYLGESA